MPLRLEITLPPQIALDLDPRRVRAVLRSAGSEIAALARRKVRQSVGTGKTYYGKEKGKHRASRRYLRTYRDSLRLACQMVVLQPFDGLCAAIRNADTGVR
jgi:hypothetical protein